jgi:hypothetical protein
MVQVETDQLCSDDTMLKVLGNRFTIARDEAVVLTIDCAAGSNKPLPEAHRVETLLVSLLKGAVAEESLSAVWRVSCADGLQEVVVDELYEAMASAITHSRAIEPRGRIIFSSATCMAHALNQSIRPIVYGDVSPTDAAFQEARAFVLFGVTSPLVLPDVVDLGVLAATRPNDITDDVVRSFDVCWWLSRCCRGSRLLIICVVAVGCRWE